MHLEKVHETIFLFNHLIQMFITQNIQAIEAQIVKNRGIETV